MDIKRHLSLKLNAPLQGLLALLPFLALIYIAYCKHSSLSDAMKQLEGCALLAKALSQSQEDLRAFERRYQGANHYYSEEVLEKLPLLAKETAAVEQMEKEALFDTCHLIGKRLTLLKENHLRLTSTKHTEKQGIIEAEEKLLAPVEIDGEDLKHLLSLIESIPVGSYLPRSDAPQMIIKRLSLERKKGKTLLDLELIKREIHEKN